MKHKNNKMRSKVQPTISFFFYPSFDFQLFKQCKMNWVCFNDYFQFCVFFRKRINISVTLVSESYVLLYYENQRLSRACIVHLVIKRTNWPYVKTMSCSGSHIGITINIKNTKFVKDLPMIDAQFRFNQCNSFREENISVFSHMVLC